MEYIYISLSSCGTVALVVLGQLSDICRSANIRKLAKDHKGYGSAANLSVDPIFQRACGSYQDFLAASKEATESRVPLGKVEVITSKILRSPSWLGWPLLNICATNDHGYVPLAVNTFRSFPHSRLITGFVTRLTRRVPLVEQELLNLPEHMSSPRDRFLVGFCYSIFSFMCMFCRSLFVLLYFFFWPLCCLFFFDIRILITSHWYLQTVLNATFNNISVISWRSVLLVEETGGPGKKLYRVHLLWAGWW